MKFVRFLAALTALAFTNLVPAFAQSFVPISYVSGTVIDMRAYGSVTLSCSVAPSAGSFTVSPDPANAVNVGTTNALLNSITVSPILNNSTGISTASNITAVGIYTIPGHQYVRISLTGGTCFIAGGL